MNHDKDLYHLFCVLRYVKPKQFCSDFFHEVIWEEKDEISTRLVDLKHLLGAQLHHSPMIKKNLESQQKWNSRYSALDGIFFPFISHSFFFFTTYILKALRRNE